MAPGVWRWTSVFHTIRPSVRSMQRTRHETPSSVAVVRKTCRSKTIGDDQPFPGILVFQTTFLSADQVTGKFFSLEMPWPFGPRNRIQFSAVTRSQVNQSAMQNENRNVAPIV